MERERISSKIQSLSQRFPFRRFSDSAEPRRAEGLHLFRGWPGVSAGVLLTHVRRCRDLRPAIARSDGFEVRSQADTEEPGLLLSPEAIARPECVAPPGGATKLPDNAVVRYHLGMAQLAAGNEGAAKGERQQALKFQSALPGADEARQPLKQLQ